MATMSKDIWHTKDENPDANVGFACYRNLSHVENCTYLQNGGFQPTGSWAYIKDLLALETDLERTRKALDKAKNGLEELKDIIACPPNVSYETGVSMYADGVLQEITVLEKSELENLEMLVNNVFK